MRPPAFNAAPARAHPGPGGDLVVHARRAILSPAVVLPDRRSGPDRRANRPEQERGGRRRGERHVSPSDERRREGEEACTVVIRNGAIVSVQRRDPSITGARVLELGADEVLLPGLVDTHVHVNEPGRTEWEGFECATRAAAAGGVTTIVDMPLNSLPPTLDSHALELKRQAALGRCSVDVGFWGGAVPGNLSALSELSSAGAFGFKAFLADSGVPEFPYLDRDCLLRACAEIAALGAVLLVHAEDPEALARAPAPAGPTYRSFLNSRPPVAENLAVDAVVDAARETGARAHIVHLSSAGALAKLRDARAEGVRITVETCPHYLTLTAEEVPDGATEYKCCPPIRTAANREFLWAALANGTIDMVVSDHSPCPPELKKLGSGDFAGAWGGISSLQIGLPLLWTAARLRNFSLGDVVTWMSSAPAQLAGLSTKGGIAVGAAGDLVVFAPEEEMVVEPRALHHRHPVTPYAGSQLFGVVRSTWLAGRQVDSVPRGRLLRKGGA